MIKLIRGALGSRAGGDKSQIVFVEFNSRPYQGYDDARAALLDVIAPRIALQNLLPHTVMSSAKALPVARAMPCLSFIISEG